MPVDEIEIDERRPPKDVVQDARRMDADDEADETRVRPHEKGWEVDVKRGNGNGGDTNNGKGKNGKGGPPDHAKAFGVRMKEYMNGNPSEIMDDKDHFRAVFKDGRFDNE